MQQENYYLAGEGLRTMFGARLAMVAGFAAVMCSPLLMGLSWNGVLAVSMLGAAAVFLGAGAELWGLYKAGPAHFCYEKAMKIALANLGIQAVDFFLVGDGTMLEEALGVVFTIFGAVEVYYICVATRDLLVTKGDGVLAQRADRLWELVAVCAGVEVVAALIPHLYLLGILADMASWAAGLVSMAAWGMQVVFYGKASRSLLGKG